MAVLTIRDALNQAKTVKTAIRVPFTKPLVIRDPSGELILAEHKPDTAKPPVASDGGELSKRRDEHQKATEKVYFGGKNASAIVLPILKK